MSKDYKVVVKRKVVVKKCTEDFGLGPGVIYTDTVEITARSESMAMVSVINNNRELLDSLVEVQMKIPKKRERK